MKRFWNIAALLLLVVNAAAQSIISDKAVPNSFSMDNIVIYVDPDDDMAVLNAAANLRDDIKAVTGKYPELTGYPYADSGKLIIIGSLEKSSLVKELVAKKADALPG